jgi:hypothetical protein
MEDKKETNLERLQKIALSNSTTEVEDKFVEYIARYLGLTDAVAVCGIMYPFGKGHPISVNQFAKRILFELSNKG